MTESNFNPSPVGASPMDGHMLLESFPTYVGAQRLVDKMSDGGFPVEHVRIVGENLRTVEHVTGRMTLVKATLAGAAAGAWFGLFIGLLFGLFTTGESWFWVVFISLLVGLVSGAVFGFVGHWATRGRRDFSSFETLQAGRYDVYVKAEYATQAATFLA
ncbi:MAG: hypothetical protein JWO11_198 [Nocardioides sp.]|nr:hypothetical protein [Nocardioides sp.]